MDYNDLPIPIDEVERAFAIVGLTPTDADIEKYSVPRFASKLYADLSVVESAKKFKVEQVYAEMNAKPDQDNIRYWLTQSDAKLAEFLAAHKANVATGNAPAWKMPQYGDFLPNGGTSPNNVQWRSFIENGVRVDKEISDANYAQALYSDALAAHLKKAADLKVNPYTGKPL